MTAILALMLTILFLGPNAARLALLQLFGGALVVIGLLYLLAFAPALFGLIAGVYPHGPGSALNSGPPQPGSPARFARYSSSASETTRLPSTPRSSANWRSLW